MTNFAPNIIKEFLLKNGFAHAALTLDALSASGCMEWQIYGIDAILGQFLILDWDINAATIRKGLKQLRDLGLLGIQKVMTKKRGRPSLLYRLPSFEAIASQLGLKLHDAENYHGVEPSGFASVRAYRAGLHRSFIRAYKGQWSRAFLGERLGVGKRTTYNYDQNTDIQVTEMLEMRPLDHTDILKLPERKTISRQFLISEYQRPMTEAEKDQHFSWVTPEARKSFHPAITVQVRLPLIRYLAQREARLGHKVYRAWQSTNYYQIASN